MRQKSEAGVNHEGRNPIIPSQSWVSQNSLGITLPGSGGFLQGWNGRLSSAFVGS